MTNSIFSSKINTNIKHMTENQSPGLIRVNIKYFAKHGLITSKQKRVFII